MILRRATLEDFQLLLDWRNDEDTRRNSHHSDIISAEQHRVWLTSVLENSNRKLYIALEEGVPAGTVRADFLPELNGHELSWTIAPAFRGRGIGKQMVKLMAELIGGKLIAEIKPGNISSIKIAEYAGLHFLKEENNILYYVN